MPTSRARLFLPLLVFLCQAGCARPANPDDCRKACERVARFKTGPLQKDMQVTFHELSEAVESTEERAKADLGLLRAQLAEGGPPFDERVLKKLSPAAKRAVLERHRWETQQLKTQRELSIKRAEDGVAAAQKQLAEAKQTNDATLKKATADALGACVEACPKRSAGRVECLLKIQAVEDIELCEGR